jgi:hypothetical protein
MQLQDLHMTYHGLFVFCVLVVTIMGVHQILNTRYFMLLRYILKDGWKEVAYGAGLDWSSNGLHKTMHIYRLPSFLFFCNLLFPNEIWLKDPPRTLWCGLSWVHNGLHMTM